MRWFALLVGTTGCLIILYALWGIGISCHYDEWVGRGLYPAVAMGLGADLYEIKAGPHVTLYGPTMALFYIPATLATTPVGAIWVAFSLNVAGFLMPLFYLIKRLLSGLDWCPMYKTITSIGLCSLILGIFANEATTHTLFRIHADLPTFSFLLVSLCLFDRYLRCDRRIFLHAASFSLVLAVWAKLPILTATVYPCIFLCIEKRFRDSLEFLLSLTIFFVSTTLLFILLYGWEDIHFTFVEYLSGSSWKAYPEKGLSELPLKPLGLGMEKLSLLEAIPLLFRFLVMYLAKYWYITISFLTIFFLTFRSRSSANSILLNLCLIYFLTLPPCLSALARWGGVENSLFFTNATGIILIVFGIASIVSRQLKTEQFFFFSWAISLLMLMPMVRLSRSSPSSTENSPHTQAFEYLASGKTDIYFGWYPLAHAFHSGEILTSIEVPTWVAYSHPEEIGFSTNHFPPNAKYLATGPTGYGRSILECFLGELREVPSPPELPSWRLFEPVSSTP